MFRNLQRKKQQLTREECIELLKSETRGVLCVIGDGGYPYGTPMNHYYCEDDSKIYFHCGKTGHRLDSIRENSKVSFTLMDKGTKSEGDWALQVRSVIVFGTAEIVCDRERVIDKTRRLSYKFTNDSEYIENELKAFCNNTLLIALTPQNICGKLVKEA